MGAGDTSVLNKRCDDCDINSKTIESQRMLLMKQDKQIQESLRIQKESKAKLNQYIKTVNEAVRDVAKSTKEAAVGCSLVDLWLKS